MNTMVEENLKVPKLRFGEFSGAWESKKLNSIANIITGSTPSTAVQEYYNGPYLFVSPFDINNNKYVEETKTTLSELGFSKCRKIAAGSVCFVCIGSTIGKVAIVKEEFATNQQINTLTAFNNFSNDYIYYYLDKISKSIKLLAGIQAVPLINKSDFSKISIKVPMLAEQEKIANYLSALDEKLNLLSEKEKNLAQYKKAMMQKLFAQEIRFKDDEGKEFEAWEEKKLGEVADNISSGKSKKVDNGKIPLYGSTGIIGFSENSDYCGTKILIARVGANAGYMYKVTGSYGVTDNTLILNVIDNNIDFIHSSLSYINLNRFIFGSGQPLITGGLLKNLLIQLPCLAEQEKIAQFLSAIDEKINAVQKQIAAMQEFKKAMLQQMFV